MSSSRSQYIQTFFSSRNGIQFVPVKGVNFDEEELLYMTSANVANKITDIIINYMKQINSIPFEVYDCTSGIGGNTLSFLERDEISKVYSFELRESRKIMLINNIREYKLDYKSIVNGAFNGIPETSKGCVAYFDPEWLSKQIPDLQYSKSEYILENARVGDYLLQEWVAKLPMCSMILFRVPPGYKFPEVNNWNIIVEDNLNIKKNSRLIICLNLNFFKQYANQNIKYSPLDSYKKPVFTQSKTPVLKYPKKQFENPEMKSIQSSQIKNTENTEKIIYKPEIKNFPESTNKYGIPNLFKSKPKQTEFTSTIKLEPKIETDLEKEQWRTNLWNYLPQLLNSFLQNTEIINKLLDSEYSQIWNDSFTDKTYDYLNNYETYEILGDTVLETTFTTYLMDRIKPLIRSGAITEEGISNLKMFYMSKTNQSKFSKQLGLINYVHIDPNIKKNMHLAEDLLESFTGALMIVGNNVKIGLGYILCYNFIVYLFNNIQIDMKYIYGPPKTQIQQMFKGLGWGEAPVANHLYNKNNDREEITLTLSLTDSAKRYLKELNISIPNTFGVGRGGTEKEAEINAYSNGFDTITKYGLTHEWVINQKFIREFNVNNTPEYSKYLENLYSKMNEFKYIAVNFNIPKASIGSDIKVLQFLGYKSGFQRPELLETTYLIENPDTDKRMNLLQGKLTLLQQYLKSELIPSINKPSESAVIGVDWYSARLEIDSIRTRNGYEFKNIIDRYLINLFNGIDGYAKAREECIEKSIDPSAIDISSNILNKYSKNPTELKLNDNISKNAYTFLKNKYPDRDESDYIITTLNYCALGFGGQQWALNSKILKILQKNKIDIEAFASPFNNTFDKYCSVFESDKVFNSLGNFFNLNLLENSNANIYANPPFVPFVLDKTVEKIKDCNSAVIITPTWEDAEWYKKLIEYGFHNYKVDSVLYETFDYESKTYKSFIPKFKTTVWTHNFDINIILENL